MASSTSSSERSIRVFAIAALLSVLMIYVNNQFLDPQTLNAFLDKRFWLQKIYGQKDHSVDIVFSGDSRVYRGLDPDTVMARIPDAHAFNFGFANGGHNSMIFGAIDKLLTTDASRPRAVILGVTPISMTKKAQLNEHYLDVIHQEHPRTNAFLTADQQFEMDYFLRSMTFKRFKKMVKGKLMTAGDMPSLFVYHSNGWLESDWEKRDPQAEVKNYTTIFKGNAIAPYVTGDIVTQTAAWRAQGIVVMGYRPPPSPAVRAAEDAQSGFDEKAFRAAFTKAGGIWVDLPDQYETYDGSHLTPESTRRLSGFLADRLAKELKAR